MNDPKQLARELAEKCAEEITHMLGAGHPNDIKHFILALGLEQLIADKERLERADQLLKQMLVLSRSNGRLCEDSILADAIRNYLGSAMSAQGKEE